MNIIKADIVVGVDVDRTLVSIGHPDGEITFLGRKMKIHKGNIEAMINHHRRGHRIKVWSAGGWQWAQTVIEWLGLEKFVDEIETKPKWVLDDAEPNTWLERYFIEGDVQL